jgi:type III secretion protein T
VNLSSIFANQALLDSLYNYFIAASFALARMSGLVIIMPVFSRIGLTGILQAAVAMILALPLVPMVAGAVAAAHLTAILITALLFKEMLIGLTIGLVLGVPIWAAEAAGSILDVQRGSAAASLFNPSATTEEGVTGTLLELVMVALYFTNGGLPLTLRTVYESYGLWPASSVLPPLTAAMGLFFLALLDNIITMGIVLVAPIVIFMLLSDLLLGLASRAAPQLNVFALSLNVKNLVFSVLLVLYGAFMLSYMGKDLELLLHAGHDLETLAKPASP